MLWHYTTEVHMPSIISDAFIRPATAYVPEGEKPIVWFSTNQFFEQTARKGVVENGVYRENLTMDEMICCGIVPFRIGVALETAPYDWHTLKELSSMSRRMARHLYNAAIAVNARPGEWRGTFDAVPREKWLAVERFQDGVWLPADIDTLAEISAAVNMWEEN